MQPKHVLGGEGRGDPRIVVMPAQNGEADTALFDNDVSVDRSNGEVFADLGNPVDRAVARADDLKDDNRAFDEVGCSERSGAGDNGIRVADGIADCRNTVVRSQRQAAAASQAGIEGAMDVPDDVVWATTVPRPAIRSTSTGAG